MGILLKNVQKVYKSGDVEVQALKNVSLTLPEGTISVILGPSGSGKSTLLNVIGGIDRANGGEVHIFDQAIHEFNDDQLTEYRRKYVGFIFQSYNLIPTLTVYENVEVGAEISESPLPIDEVLKGVGMYDKKDKFPQQLSGGEQQRVAIARALVKNPRLLLCDEPTGALDEETGKTILRLLQDVHRQFGTTILIITHNQGISAMAHWVVKMKSGELVECAKNEHPIDAEKVNWV
ncbi:putative ABC transport system ATP-binding protein [Thermolongibacillus altinsuensis]|uniref:Putative ABC transport system ATP-binding protein n=1 Tax=Thermolongibacillus altinsuensis TaxID=575256 RepID=A0A4R1Q8X8_9BACL|nr:ABC transporter ATP-binding protein [Thermolongibacillus altinsuensis]TCL44909.1 putative ABC transport system ATP-binding protein [Thermolongibacillus altinsuensis]GMB08166.1 ABC transporter ATP-binding protein [Thermolongibacillus altinsuensis]